MVLNMGGEDKDQNIAQMPVRNEDLRGVFDVALSKLMQDFTTAEMFPQSADNVFNKNGSNEDTNFDAIIIALKHLHVRRVVNSRQKITRRQILRKKRSLNSLNLSVAAGSYQRPIIWPARLNSQSQKANFCILNPSRLNIATSCSRNPLACQPPDGNNATATSSKNVHGKYSGPQLCIPFGTVSSFDYSSLSFSSLCEQANKNLSANSAASLNSVSPSTSHLEASSVIAPKHFSSGCVQPAKIVEDLNKKCELISSQSVFSAYRCAVSPYSDMHGATSACSSSQISGQLKAEELSTSNLLNLQSVASSPHLASLGPADGPNLNHTCSLELRMEETNVNELASYFDDLLHIPRKMSTMAEMMYA